MILTLVLILLLIWAAVVWSIYSNFLVFYSNFNESENYHKAYYNSIAALERAELVTKQRSPWYEWNGWWKIGEAKWEWSIAKWWSDGVIPNFSYLSNSESTDNTSTVFWDIKSRTTRIPAIWNGDIESMLASISAIPDDPENSSNFNMMDYNDAQIFLLYYDDNLTLNPYTKIKCNVAGSCTQSAPKIIKWKIRLPKFLQDKNFWELDESNSLVDKSSPGNDAIVDRQIRWKYNESNQFTIYATQRKKSQSSKKIDSPKDSAIRESHIKNGLSFQFSKTSKRSPTSDGKNADLTIISPKENDIKRELWWQDDANGNLTFHASNTNPYFEKIFTDNKYTEKQLRFSLLNLLQTKTTDASNNKITPKIYPFLEYYVEFFNGEANDTPVIVSDKYFTINAEWNYGDYKINKIIWKPTSKESVLWNFTSVF